MDAHSASTLQPATCNLLTDYYFHSLHELLCLDHQLVHVAVVLDKGHGLAETGDKFLIQPKDTPVVWMGGLYRIEEGLPVFVILTREAAEPIRFIHDRMPLILPEDRIDEWIQPDSPADRLAELARTDMIFERAG